MKRDQVTAKNGLNKRYAIIGMGSSRYRDAAKRHGIKYNYTYYDTMSRDAETIPRISRQSEIQFIL